MGQVLFLALEKNAKNKARKSFVSVEHAFRAGVEGTANKQATRKQDY